MEIGFLRSNLKKEQERVEQEARDTATLASASTAQPPPRVQAAPRPGGETEDENDEFSNPLSNPLSSAVVRAILVCLMQEFIAVYGSAF